MRLAGAARRDRRNVAFIDDRLAGDIEADRDHRRSADAAKGVKDDARGLGIVPDIELGGRRHIARLAIGAAHDDEPLEEARQLRLAHDRERYIGQGPDGDENEPPGVRAGRGDDALDRVRDAVRFVRLRQDSMPEAALAVDLARIPDGDGKRARRARPDGDSARRARARTARVLRVAAARETLPTTVETPRMCALMAQA